MSADGQVSAVVMKERMERAEKDLEELVQVRLGRGRGAGVPATECALTEVVMNLCSWRAGIKDDSSDAVGIRLGEGCREQ